MLRMYAACLELATKADIHAIKKALGKGPAALVAIADSRAAIPAVNTATIASRRS